MRRRTISVAGGMLLFAASAAPAAVTGTVKLRSAPANNSAVLASLPAGTVVNVFSCAGAWCRVSWGRTIGYTARRYVGADPPPVVAETAGSALYSWHRGWRHRYWHHQWYSEREMMTIRR
jgi:hypothetical protein